LRKHRLDQAEAALAIGRKVQLDDYVLTASPDGKPYKPDTLSTSFKRFLAELRKKHPELPRIRFHDLRHSKASHLLGNGASVLDVQGLLGHSSAKMTLDVYGHLMPNAHESVDRADQALARALTKAK
jgi:integrase